MAVSAPAQTAVSTQQDSSYIFTILEHAPEFPGGIAAMQRYVASHVHYPTAAREAGISGKSIFKFVINEDGSIGAVEKIKGVIGCAECDEEVERTIKAMPRWTPGKLNGRAVKCYFTLPMNICYH